MSTLKHYKSEKGYAVCGRIGESTEDSFDVTCPYCFASPVFEKAYAKEFQLRWNKLGQNNKKAGKK